MKTYNVAILGASGAVGQMMLQVLEERKFPIHSIKLLTSAKSAGQTCKFQGNDVVFEEAKESSFQNVEIVFGAVENDLSKMYTPAILEANALYIDNSSAYRLDKNVPLVIPEINPQTAFINKGIIANPNCATILALMAIYPIHCVSPVQRMVVSTYQAVSGAGKLGTDELHDQIYSENPAKNKVFKKKIAFNVIPQIGEIDKYGYTSEEMKLQNESRKILNCPELLVNCTCVRVPVKQCHSESITLETKDDLTLDQVIHAYDQKQGVMLDHLPTPLEWTDQDQVVVGRIRKDLTKEKSISLWCCADQLRKGAATNAVQIAELFIK